MSLAHALLPALLAAGIATSASAEAIEGLEPFQLTRSLQLIQDRIADGDHAAMPMQRKLLELLDGRLRSIDPHELSQRRNFAALLTYGMSGGNPTTFAISSAKLELQETESRIVDGINAFLNGNAGMAYAALGGVDHTIFDGELGALLALVKGSVTPAAEPAAALALFDRARLLAPGTLVEEAALRRSIPLLVTLEDAQRFDHLASAYVRRFLRSPYASQFAQGFVEGVAALFPMLDHAGLEDTISRMNAEQAQAIFLRLARQAAIDGNDALLDFASGAAQRVSGDRVDPRSTLYSGIASVTSETVEDVLGALNDLDRSRLSTADKALLEAATRIADAVVTEPTLDPTDPGEEPDMFVTSARQKLDAIDALLEGNEE